MSVLGGAGLVDLSQLRLTQFAVYQITCSDASADS